MNPPLLPLHPNFIPRPSGPTSIWDLLALELANEWRGLDSDNDDMPERDAPFSPPWGARSPYGC
jgi:hypothetical protein